MAYLQCMKLFCGSDTVSRRPKTAPRGRDAVRNLTVARASGCVAHRLRIRTRAKSHDVRWIHWHKSVRVRHSLNESPAACVLTADDGRLLHQPECSSPYDPATAPLCLG